MHPQAGIGAILDTLPVQPRLDGIVLAQVFSVSPTDHAVQVIFTTLAGVLTPGTGQAFKVKVLQRRAGITGAILELPQVGEWGLVCFPHGSDQMAVWLGSLNRDLSNLTWDGIGPTTRLDQHESGVYRLIDDDGNVDTVFADGTYLRVGSGSTLADREHYERQGQGKRSIPFANPTGVSATVHVQHSSGTTVTIDPDGTLTVHGVAPITVQGDATIMVNGTGNVTVKSAAEVLVDAAVSATVQGGGPALTIIGGIPKSDFVVLLRGLTNLISWLTTHTHLDPTNLTPMTGMPVVAPPPPVAGIDFTVNTVAS